MVKLNSLKSSLVSVVIPAFREEKTIGDIVKRTLALQEIEEVIVVDDGSDDETAAKAEQSGAKVISHPYNMGNGASIKTGIRHAKGEVLVFLDGDGQHAPEEIPLLLAQINNFDMVVGARSSQGQSSIFRMVANAVYNRLASYVTQFPVKDLTSGFRAIKRNTARKFLYLLPNTFSYPSTITLALLRSGYPVTYIPIKVSMRHGMSKINHIRDGARFFLIILKITMLFSPLRVFLPVSLLLAALSLFNYAYTFFTTHRFTNMSALLAMTSVLIFMMGLIAEQVSQLRMDRSEDDLQ